MGEETPDETSGDGCRYRDSDVLRHYCHDRGLSLREMAARLGCSRTTVATWTRRHGIERRNATEHVRRTPAHFRTHQGYERWYTTVDGTTTSVLVHRLLAVSEFGFDAVAGNDVHHINGIRWDNRLENITLLSREHHARLTRVRERRRRRSGCESSDNQNR